MSSFIFCVLAASFGAFCAIFTNFSIKIVVIALGAVSIVKGVFDLIRFRKVIADDKVFHRTLLIRSLVSILVGLLAVALPMAFFKTAETVVHILLYVLGVYFLFSAIVGVIMIRRLRDAEQPTKTLSSAIVVYLLIAILLFLLAAIGVKTILRVAGIVVAVGGVFGCIYTWRNRTQELKPDAISDASDEKIEVEIKEDSDGENKMETPPSSDTDDDGDYSGE